MAVHASGLVIFDCDGVLVDSEPISLAVLVESLEAAGVFMTTSEAGERFLGRSLKSMSAILHEEYGLATDDAFLEGMRMRLYARFRQELKPVRGVREAASQLDGACCVASSSQPERIRLSLTVTGLIDLFEPHIFSASMVAHGKPAPDLFLHASAEMGYRPADCIVIEDSPAGIEAAKAAGMRVFAFAGASHARNERHRQALASLDPDVLFDDMDELIQFVRQ
ncbi:Hydrolase in polyol utilization gene cluster, haloacid dehalogenase-like family [Sinorhizobium sojae CCBAU 05684]|uniref:Hydrolase in polyol utilization gene cluster, haloacid dehalogenase-like family n=1 Tax=Sinorhizobium sojae CCBAU 05684 TaxID=716928 RepID=A0A249PDE2_9HYPH|nr:HAD family hydrolase [Sinorhizobium sojae]ASY63980.1 Hydrolase in polyol utilization gene cluster, haloacid dehalogenase-like family [Sinorhizobium sojae CCBAU 05684]